MTELKIHDLRGMDLMGGTLVVGIPHQGIGTALLTEFIVEQAKMDQTASFESDAFPPVTVLHTGRPRSALRIHASEAKKVAILRCEFPPGPSLARPIAASILEWCRRNGIGRIVTLDGVAVMGTRDAPPSLLVAASSDVTRKALTRELGLEEFQDGALGGVPGILLTEGRRTGVDVVALVAVLSRPEDDVRGAKAVANRATSRLVSVEARYEDLPSAMLLRHRSKEGAACPRCGVALRRAKVGGRTTVFCPGHQKRVPS